MKKINKYQHLKCTFWISVAAVIVLIISLVVPVSPWSSILQNIFAGLITGVVVALISSLKNKELKNAEIEEQFLKMTHDLYVASRKAYVEYRKARHKDDDAYFEATYDLLDELESVESFIGFKDKDDRLVRILGKKPSEYFEEDDGYCFAEQKQRHHGVYDRLNSNMYHDEEDRKEIDKMIESICRAHRVVKRKTINRSVEIFEEKIDIETSVP